MGTRILTVEDDERIRTAVKMALEDEGWVVEEADNGEDALIMTSDKLATLQPLHDKRLQTVSLRLSRTYDLRMLKPDR